MRLWTHEVKVITPKLQTLENVYYRSGRPRVSDGEHCFHLLIGLGQNECIAASNWFLEEDSEEWDWIEWSCNPSHSMWSDLAARTRLNLTF